jgi:archaellin
MFSGNGMWAKPTLNFSSLSAPLSEWTRSYDSISNTTTYTKTISGESTLSSKYSIGGQTYSLAVTSDPSASISTHGYAVASGNSLMITKAPLTANPVSWVAAAVAAVVAIGGAAYLVRRSRAAGRIGPAVPPPAELP